MPRVEFQQTYSCDLNEKLGLSHILWAFLGISFLLNLVLEVNIYSDVLD